MKPYIIPKSLTACMAAAAMAVAMVSCDQDLDLPPVNAPQVDPSVKVTSTILDLKKLYWSTDRNYADTIGLTASGEHTVIAGRVISSDSTGNIYKSLIIQDATAALAISLDTTKLYQSYPLGEEVYIDLTGMYVGKYNGLFQMGNPQPYQNTYEISFMPYWKFAAVSQRNGLPDINRVDTIHTTIAQIKEWRSSQDDIMRYQSQLVCLDSVEFVGGGSLTWADNGNNVNRTLRDKQGNTLIVRNSGYASFGRDIMPAGRGSVVAILSFYGTDWQLMMRTTLDCHGFSGVPSDPSGPDAPADGKAEFKSVKQVTSGKEYVMVADGLMALPLTSNYGWLKVDSIDVTADGRLTTELANAFTFTAVEGGYTIADQSGKYYYMTGTFNSFNRGDAGEGSVWSVTANEDGTMSVTNVDKAKTIQYDSQYGSFGAYPSKDKAFPVLYERVK